MPGQMENTVMEFAERGDSLKDKGAEQSEDIPLHEIELHGIWKKIYNLIRNIPHAFWSLTGMVLLVLLLSFTPHHLWTRLLSGFKEHAGLLILVLLFGFVAVSLLWSIGQRIDVWVFKLLNVDGRRAPWLDKTMLGLTQLGNGISILIVVVVLFLRVRHLLAYELIVGALSLGLSVEIIKAMIHRTRPFVKLKDIRIVGSRASGRSFPSGHTSQTFFMATLLVHYYQGSIFILLLLYVIATLVGITRIYLGMHYPRDVLAGAMLGTAWGMLGVIVNSHLWGNI